MTLWKVVLKHATLYGYIILCCIKWLYYTVLQKQDKVHPTVHSGASHISSDSNDTTNDSIQRKSEPWHAVGIGPYTFVDVKNGKEVQCSRYINWYCISNTLQQFYMYVLQSHTERSCTLLLAEFYCLLTIKCSCKSVHLSTLAYARRALWVTAFTCHCFHLLTAARR
jgi:hypothetical protein